MPARVMVVEDDLIIALLLQYNLEAAGYVVEHLDRGDSAEARIVADAPDLLVLDWMLPGLSGIELCRRLRRHEALRSLPIMIVTARGNTADREFALRSGANDVVAKPFSLSDVISRARALLPAPPQEVTTMSRRFIA